MAPYYKSPFSIAFCMFTRGYLHKKQLKMGSKVKKTFLRLATAPYPARESQYASPWQRCGNVGGSFGWGFWVQRNTVKPLGKQVWIIHHLKKSWKIWLEIVYISQFKQSKSMALTALKLCFEQGLISTHWSITYLNHRIIYPLSVDVTCWV